MNRRVNNQFSDSIFIQFPEMEYLFPNVFTPNGDGQNDGFHLVYHNQIENLEIIILNRWGNVVFESDLVDFVWNGQIKNTGNECNDGVYYYKAVLKNKAGEEKIEHGYVHLNR